MNTNRLPDPLEALGLGNPLLLSIEDVLSAAECAALIARIEEAGPTDAPVTTSRGMVMMPELRNNTRVMFDDGALAKLLFDRVSAALPPRLEKHWVLSGVNERLRCYRYGPDEYFRPHYDGAWQPSADERSLLTFMVYLNDVDAGGATAFPSLAHSVVPRAGRALLFNHRLLHESTTLEQGLKYAVRTDVMYRRDVAASG